MYSVYARGYQNHSQDTGSGQKFWEMRPAFVQIIIYRPIEKRVVIVPSTEVFGQTLYVTVRCQCVSHMSRVM